MKTENGRGRGGGGWSLVKDMIDLAKKEVITVPAEQRERVLARARRQAEIWRRDLPASNTAAQRPAATGRPGQPEPAPQLRTVSQRHFVGRIPPRSATAST